MAEGKIKVVNTAHSIKLAASLWRQRVDAMKTGNLFFYLALACGQNIQTHCLHDLLTS